LTKAAELYEQAFRTNSDDYQAPALLVGVYKSLRREAESAATQRRALRVAERQIEFHPDDARAPYLGASMLCQLGERTQSLDWAHRALKIDPEEPSILYSVACVYALLGETEEAGGRYDIILGSVVGCRTIPTSILCESTHAFRAC
jgi:adenylate cyclase